MKLPFPARPLALGAAALTAGAFAFVAPAGSALAQTYAGATVEELTVTPGRLGPDGQPQSLSRAVNISDLDLRYDRDVRLMKQRVRTTARHLCEELGETGGAGATPSCEDEAVRHTDRQMRIAVADARSGAYYAYAAPPAYAGEYAPPASAVVPYQPVTPDDYPPDL